MSLRLKWLGNEVAQQITRGAVSTITEIDQRIETEAKKELYPGHGVRTGTLRRSVQGEVGRVMGRRVVGRVGTKGVRYALRLHRRYQYIVNGLGRVRPLARGILSKHVRGG